YGVERSVDGGTTFTTISTAAAKNNGATAPLANYATLDAQPNKGDNYYRIRIEGVDGKVSYSNVVKVTVGEDMGGKTLITLYPNPVSRKEGKATLSLKNVQAGDYLMSVYSSTGQNLLEKKITVAAGTRAQNESVPLPQQLAQGNYQLQLSTSSGTIVFTSKFIVGK
ncbi:MAG: T9SS type A sorting domain-containing protein, partial [Bacteroidota bacterium]|nr:T9SS type A sorting domain-containing protein [Bacteroidota bacterium]